MSIGIYSDGKRAFFERDDISVIAQLYRDTKKVFEVDIAREAPTDRDVKKIGEIDVREVSDGSTYRVVMAEGDVGKPSVNRKPDAEPGKSVIQSVLFHRDTFDLEQARAWLAEHEGFGDYGVDETKNTYRFRQYDPEHFSEFRTGEITTGVTAVYGIVAGDVEQEDAGEKTEEEKSLIRDLEKQKEKTGALVSKLNQEINERGLRFLLKGDEEEERFVMSLVLEPNDGVDAPLKPDTQNDIYSAEEIRNAAHAWMEFHGKSDLGHSWVELGKRDVRILESYLAPCDFELGGYSVVKGTWMLGLRIVSDDLWEGVKSGEIGAYSIGGRAMREPAEEGTGQDET